MNTDRVRGALRQGAVIPAHPLALTAERTIDERRQRGLTRYYVAAGAGGIAVGVHTTQFAIHNPSLGLLRPVLELAAETAAESGGHIVTIAGACGDTPQAVSETELAASLGYDAVLLSPIAQSTDEQALLDRARAVSEVLPVIGFYLQRAVGGPPLSLDFWREFVTIPQVVGIKAAPFDRYATLDVARALGESGRDDIALYTGNDDAIIADLLARYRFGGSDVRVVGGLLGQWAVWTRAAVELLHEVRRGRDGDRDLLARWVARASAVTDANSAIFDSAHGFRGCIPGIHEILRRQGLLSGLWCLDPNETLSAGQLEEIDRVCASYPWLTDDSFVAENLDQWLR